MALVRKNGVWSGSGEEEGGPLDAADILEAIKTVDGAGSGLDADTLDGQQAAAFQPVDPDLTALAAAGNSAILAAVTAAFTTALETKLSGIETGATADQTAAEILTKILSVDGSHSGLDADMIDGKHVVVLTQAAYNALGTKDSNTVYYIVG